MRKNVLFVLLSALFLAGCTHKNSVMTIKMNNCKDTQWKCLLPIDGQIAVYANDTLRIGGDAVFNVEVRSQGLTTVAMFSDNQYISTPAGEDFTIIVDPSDSTMPVKFEGRNAAGRDLLYKLSKDKDLYKYEWIKDFGAAPLDTSAVVMAANLKKIADDEIAQLETLYKEKKIDRRFYDFAKRDIEIYYDAVLSKVIGSNYRKGIDSMYSDYQTVWTEIYDKQPVTGDLFRYSYGSRYADMVALNYFVYLDQKKTGQQFSPKTMGEYNSKILGGFENNVEDPQARKFYTMNKLFLICLNNKTFDKEVVGYIDDFKSKYPQSEMNSYFAKHKEIVENYYKAIEAEFSPEVKFVENSAQITTLKDLIAKFKGRKLFIDFWFTTCGPCVEEFKYNAPLHEFLKKNDIDMLYFSIDSPEKEKQWQNAIKYYDLKGYHIRADMPLWEDIANTHGIQMYPRYMIVGADGVIVEPDAKTPSSGEELYKQIEEKLKL